jgi:hypothetical protein
LIVRWNVFFDEDHISFYEKKVLTVASPLRTQY